MEDHSKLPPPPLITLPRFTIVKAQTPFLTVDCDMSFQSIASLSSSKEFRLNTAPQRSQVVTPNVPLKTIVATSANTVNTVKGKNASVGNKEAFVKRIPPVNVTTLEQPSSRVPKNSEKDYGRVSISMNRESVNSCTRKLDSMMDLDTATNTPTAKYTKSVTTRSPAKTPFSELCVAPAKPDTGSKSDSHKKGQLKKENPKDQRSSNAPAINRNQQHPGQTSTKTTSRTSPTLGKNKNSPLKNSQPSLTCSSKTKTKKTNVVSRNEKRKTSPLVKTTASAKKSRTSTHLEKESRQDSTPTSNSSHSKAYFSSTDKKCVRRRSPRLEQEGHQQTPKKHPLTELSKISLVDPKFLDQVDSKLFQAWSRVGCFETGGWICRSCHKHLGTEAAVTKHTCQPEPSKVDDRNAFLAHIRQTSKTLRNLQQMKNTGKNKKK